jgi:crotonobetainyl-CoA:carnitine CoA-transferase CaiB-like acyl-CoA transferase
MSAPYLPLEGIRVVEFSHMVMGPSCGLMLADLGAEVIKVEPGPKGDRTRYLTSTGAGFFAGFNRNKKSVMLDLDTPEGPGRSEAPGRHGRRVHRELPPRRARGQGPGLRGALGAQPAAHLLLAQGIPLRAVRERTALDEVAQMMTGLAYMTGPPGKPLRAGAPVNDMMGGLFGAFAIMAALRQRDRTGRGELVQSGLFENSAYLVSTHMLQHVVSGKKPVPMSAGMRAWGVYDVFQSSDDVSIFIGVVTERQWEIFTKALKEPELLDPAYATNNERSRAREKLIPLVAKLVRKHPIAELERLCEDAGLPFARVNHPSDLFDDPHLNAGGMVPLTLADGKQTKVPGLPIQFGDTRPGLRTDLPTPGQHTDEILRELGIARQAA